MSEQENTIIARLQNRRGLKQDLPQPLRPGEIGFAIDSKQVYIGSDPSDAVSAGYNSASIFEYTSNSRDITLSIADNNIIKFSVPHKIYNKGTLTSLSNQLSWLPTSVVSSTDADPVFTTTVTAGDDSNTVIKSITTNSAFRASDIVVFRNGSGLSFQDSVTASTPLLADYGFTASVASSGTHTLTLRTLPASSDHLAISYYSNTDIVSSLTRNTTFAGSTLSGFYQDHGVPEYLQIPPKNITVSPSTGTGYIGLEFKHLAVIAAGSDVADPTTLVLGNLMLSLASDAVTGVDIAYSANTVVFTVGAGHPYTVGGSYGHVYVSDAVSSGINNTVLAVTSGTATTITVAVGVVVDDVANITATPVLSINVSSATDLAAATALVDGASHWPTAYLAPGVINQINVTHKPEYSVSGVDFRLHEDVGNTLAELGLEERQYNTTTTVKARLENWLNAMLADDAINLFTSASVIETYSEQANPNITTWALDVNFEYNELRFDSREEARDFNNIVNRIYYQRSNSDIRGLVNLKTNIELVTLENFSINAGPAITEYITPNEVELGIGTSAITGLSFDARQFDTYFIDYSVREPSLETGPNELYHRTGTLQIAGRPDFFGATGSATINDISTEMIDSGLTGLLTFSTSITGNTVTVTSENTLGVPLSMRYIIRRWSS